MIIMHPSRLKTGHSAGLNFLEDAYECTKQIHTFTISNWENANKLEWDSYQPKCSPGLSIEQSGILAVRIFWSVYTEKIIGSLAP